MLMSRFQGWGHQLITRLAPAWRARSLPGVPGRVHKNDVMLQDESEGGIALYLRAGNSAIQNISEALTRGGRSFEDIEFCLDFGCGHGRVLRHLQQLIPPYRITACDIDAEGVGFCAGEFGVRARISHWKVGEIRLGTYDLIWSGSVFTHLPPADCETLFAKLGRSLAPRGVLVFSVHGEYSLGGLEHFYDGLYGGEAAQIRREVAEQEISFRPYDESFGTFKTPYGMTWHHREYFENRAFELFGDRLEPILWKDRGWDLHHDVIAFQRVH